MWTVHGMWLPKGQLEKDRQGKEKLLQQNRLNQRKLVEVVGEVVCAKKSGFSVCLQSSQSYKGNTERKGEEMGPELPVCVQDQSALSGEVRVGRSK